MKHTEPGSVRKHYKFYAAYHNKGILEIREIWAPDIDGALMQAEHEAEHQDAGTLIRVEPGEVIPNSNA